MIARGVIAILQRRGIKGAAIGAAIGGLVACTMLDGRFGISDLKVLRTTELVTVDRRFLLAASDHWYSPFRRPGLPSDELLVVTIDEETLIALEKTGISFPFPRYVWQELVATLTAMEVRAIGLDVAFSDRRETATRTGDPYAECEPGDADCATAEQINRLFGAQLLASGNVVVGANAVEVGGTIDPEEALRIRGWHRSVRPFLEAASVPVSGAGKTAQYVHTKGATGSILRLPEPNVLAGARALGVVNYAAQLDADDRIRRVAPAVRFGEEVQADLGLALLSVAMSPRGSPPPWDGARPPSPSGRPPLAALTIGPRSVSVAKYELPLGGDGTVWLYWRGNWGRDPRLTSRVVSAKEIFANMDRILLGKDSPEPPAMDVARFKDKIVLVGVTAQGEFSDFVGTPFGGQPGVFKHATTVDTFLTLGRFQTPPRAFEHLLTILLSALCGALVLGLPQFRWQLAGSPLWQAVWALVPGLGMTLGYGALAGLVFRFGWIVDVAHVTLAMSGTILLCFSLRYREEEEKKKEAHGHLRRAFGPEIADKVIREGDPTLGGAKSHLTLFFSDIAGFTTISESLTPEELVAVLNEYLTRVTDLVITKHHGILDKYIGDAIMAYWGSPLPDPQGPLRACLAAIDAVAVIDAYSAELMARGLPPLATRIGLNSGMAVAGFVGHPERKSPTVLGDTVNLAARLEGANKAYGTTCIAGEETIRLAGDAIVARELDLVKVKGKHIPVRVFELLGRAGLVDPRRIRVKDAYEAALARYRRAEFTEALAAFEAIVAVNEDGPSRTMIRNCREKLEIPPPPGWDGSNVLHEK